MAKIELQLPLKHIMVNQPFGVNYLDFYQRWGLKGHNGLDMEAKDGCKVYATHSGIVKVAGRDGDGGVCVEILACMGEGYKTIYYHLKETKVSVKDFVQAGQCIGLADNTGIYTTGDHLHLGLKLTNNGDTINKDNGFYGAIDPVPYFPKDWDKSLAYKRYGRVRTWALYQLEIKKMVELTIKLKRKPTFEEINAVVYGYWDIETIKNVAMRYNWLYLTKPGMEHGEKPFI